ncbi:MAG: hypothetical protein OXQ96_01330 [Alphaproteobacteria bacterium]|nr:hypothetical protein [Alphaproteobacteria bacterium]
MASKSVTECQKLTEFTQRLKDALPEDAFSTWFENKTCFEISDCGDFVTVFSADKLNWVESHYHNLILEIGNFKSARYLNKSPDQIIDLPMAYRVRDIKGAENIAANTRKAMAVKAASDTDAYIQQEEQRQASSNNYGKAKGKARTAFNGKHFTGVSLKTLEDLDTFLMDKPRPLNALRIFHRVIARMDWENYKCPYAPTDLAKELSIDKGDASRAFKQLQEFGIVKLVKRGRTNEIWLNPYHAFRGLNGVQTAFLNSYEQAVKKEEEKEQLALAM